MSLVGRRLGGQYDVLKLLGHGGMGAVYEAVPIGGGAPLAIKVLDSALVQDEGVRQRFAREARILRQVASPHVVKVHDSGTEGGCPYLVMDLLRGRDLGQRLRDARTLPLDEALTITAEVLEGLAAAHDEGVLHRDLKPDNVFLAEGLGRAPRATLIDFGMAKEDRPGAETAPLALTTRGTVVGTPLYLSPEQARAAALDARADLYSVGAILFECLTGRPPHTGESHEQVLLSICTADAPDVRAIDPTIPDEVARFLRRALARDRSARFASAHAMRAELLALRAGPDATPGESGVAGRPARDDATAPHRRPLLLVLGVLAAALGALTTALVVAWNAPRSAPPAPPPQGAEARPDAGPRAPP